MFNNVREYPDMFYRIENNSANSVFITCRTSDKESVRNWIEAFNDTEIIYEEEVIRFIVDADYDSRVITRFMVTEFMRYSSTLRLNKEMVLCLI